MRNFKKYFFESLIHLTILANVFRNNSRYTSLTGESFFTDQFENNNFPLTSQNYTPSHLELILLNHRLNNAIFNDPSSHEYLSLSYSIKEIDLSHNIDIDRLYRLVRTDSSQSFFIPVPIVLQPASAIYIGCQQKGVIDRSEMRILLSSLELNYQNNHTLRKVSQLICLFFLYLNINIFRK